MGKIKERDSPLFQESETVTSVTEVMDGDGSGQGLIIQVLAGSRSGTKTS